MKCSSVFVSAELTSTSPSSPVEKCKRSTAIPRTETTLQYLIGCNTYRDNLAANTARCRTSIIQDASCRAGYLRVVGEFCDFAIGRCDAGNAALVHCVVEGLGYVLESCWGVSEGVIVIVGGGLDDVFSRAGGVIGEHGWSGGCCDGFSASGLSQLVF